MVTRTKASFTYLPYAFLAWFLSQGYILPEWFYHLLSYEQYLTIFLRFFFPFTSLVIASMRYVFIVHNKKVLERHLKSTQRPNLLLESPPLIIFVAFFQAWTNMEKLAKALIMDLKQTSLLSDGVSASLGKCLQVFQQNKWSANSECVVSVSSGLSLSSHTRNIRGNFRN